MPQPFALPLANHMLALLIAAALLPLLFGLLARAFFFRHDADDASRAPRAIRAAETAPATLRSPEPEPRCGKPWEAPGTAAAEPPAPAAEASAAARTAAARAVEQVLPRRGYELRVIDATVLAAQLDAAWRELLGRLVTDPAARERYHWPPLYAPATAPYELVVTPAPQGGTMTVTVSAVMGGGFGADLMRLWDEELLPALQKRIGSDLRPAPRQS